METKQNIDRFSMWSDEFLEAKRDDWRGEFLQSKTSAAEMACMSSRPLDGHLEWTRQFEYYEMKNDQSFGIDGLGFEKCWIEKQKEAILPGQSKENMAAGQLEPTIYEHWQNEFLRHEKPPLSDNDISRFEEAWRDSQGRQAFVDKQSTRHGSYMFEVDNPYLSMDGSYEKGIYLMEEDPSGSLTQAALAFEAVIQSGPPSKRR